MSQPKSQESDTTPKVLRQFRVKIGNNFYSVRLWDELEDPGTCSHPDDGSPRYINIRYTGDTKNDADTIIHEVLHAVGFGWEGSHGKLYFAAEAAVKIMDKLDMLTEEYDAT